MTGGLPKIGCNALAQHPARQGVNDLAISISDKAKNQKNRIIIDRFTLLGNPDTDSKPFKI